MKTPAEPLFTPPPTTHNHQQCVHNALKTAETLCVERGVQLTSIRHQVLELIWESHKAVKAYELLDRIKPLQNAAKPATIYRALDFLITQGLIHRVESLNAFVGCRCSGRQHEQLLLICKQCEEVEERTASQVMQALAEEFQRAGFTAHSKAVEVHGLCQRCAGLSSE
ncbi:MAG: transcriptional repressor [Methylovulum sp.]|uniref:transcriptional repressor n=1 Tax=Methylovulum sp. TaxID=1916980 RepID=UPI00261AA4E3|nr:transcriptional repressor [Methylovulum sp.]MDD2722401.1 transcriptional repressor [Methylovulum sp.]MDD5125774.1 transcriptional repressor [Methylovulum sp.]